MHVPNIGDRDQVVRGLAAMDEENYSAAAIVWDGLSSAQRDQLNQLLHQGPVFDGNVLSKSARDDLLDYGLAVRCCFMGEDGYTAATYRARTVFHSGKSYPFKCYQGSPSS